MRRRGPVVLVVLGALLAVAGLAAAVLLGPSSRVVSGPTKVATTDARAVVSSAGVLAFTDVTVEVTAENPGGEVFVGEAHPIDIASWLGSHPRQVVTGVGPRGLATTRAGAGGSRDPFLAPEKAPMWRQQAHGRGAQSLRIVLDGQPKQYAVVPAGGSGSVAVSSATLVPGGFALSVAALVLGLLLVVAGIVLRRRGRSPGSDATATVAAERPRETTAPRAGSTAEGGSTREGGSTQATHTTSRVARRRARAVLPGALLIPALAGCAMVPSQSEAWQLKDLSKPAMTRDEASAAMTRYDTVNNTAIATTAKTHNPEAWSAVDSGPILAVDHYVTAVQKIHGSKPTPVKLTHAPVAVHAGAYAAYPMAAIVASTVTVSPMSEKERQAAAKQDLLDVGAYVRSSASAHWRLDGRVDVPRTSMPRPLAPGAASTPTAAQKAAVLASARQLPHAVAGKPSALTLPKEVAAQLAEERKGSTLAKVSVTADFWHTATDQLAPGGSITAARVDGGVLALVTYRSTWHYVSRSGNRIQWTGDLAPLHSTVPSRELTTNETLMAVIRIDDGGTPRVLGVERGNVL